MNAKTIEDIVQDAMLVIYKKYKKVKLKKGILPWAYTVLDKIMWNEYRTWIRREDKKKDNKDAIGQIHAMNEPGEDLASFEVLLDEIWRALSKLNKHEKEIVVLILKGCSRGQIMNQLGIPRGTLDARIWKGRRKLKRELELRGAL